MGRASDAPLVASADTRAVPRTPASWLLSADRSQTAAPLPGGSDPRSEPRNEPAHKAPRPSSPGPCLFPAKAICCWSFTPAQPDNPVASLRDFCSGAYNPRDKPGDDELGVINLIGICSKWFVGGGGRLYTRAHAPDVETRGRGVL